MPHDGCGTGVPPVEQGDAYPHETNLIVSSLDTEALLEKITADFIAAQSQKWLHELYHILAAFLGHALPASLRMKLRAAAPGLTPRAVIEKLSSIRMVDVCIPATDGRLLVMPRYIEPEEDQQLILSKLRLALPPQPPPRIRSGQGTSPESILACSAGL